MGVADKLGKAKLAVCLAYEHSETTEAADVVFPVHHPLESWGDYTVRAGVTGLMQPVRAPLHPTRHAGDLLIRLARKADRKVRRSTYKDYVIAHCASLLGIAGTGAPDAPVKPPPGMMTVANPPSPSAVAALEPMETPPAPRPAPLPPDPVKMRAAFEKMLVAGGVFEETKVADQPTPRGVPAYRLPAVNTATTTGTLLSVSHSALLGDGRGTVADWLLEIPDSMTQSAWEVPAEIDATSAKAAGIETGDRIELATGAGKVQATAVVSTDAAHGSVTLRMGGGRRFAREQVTSGNAASLLAATMDPESGELARAGVPVKVTRIASGELVTVSGGVRSEGRKLALAMTESEAKAGKWPYFTRHGEVLPGEHHEPEQHLVPMPHQDREGEQGPDNSHVLVEHPVHRWGLVVDLDLCTGCGACTAACYAENNIPVVGSERIRQGREMTWLRIEKHVFGDDADPTVRFLPVMCQHCAQAPCETVCPVFAPYHTPDGINAQIYNRCIGTRYCANNCPYKVRRFNFFKYPTEGDEIQRLNPDVTVRHRGVMEKCTLCIQRIREATNRAKVEKRGIADGEIVPACVQTCPTGAMSFGDFKKDGWAMTRLAKDPRGYRILDYLLNTRPGVVYLRRVEPDGRGV
jgi:molybdopterin-containing oxidoreductase family iron-sulfur binding subunit